MVSFRSIVSRNVSSFGRPKNGQMAIFGHFFFFLLSKKIQQMSSERCHKCRRKKRLGRVRFGKKVSPISIILLWCKNCHLGKKNDTWVFLEEQLSSQLVPLSWYFVMPITDVFSLVHLKPSCYRILPQIRLIRLN